MCIRDSIEIADYFKISRTPVREALQLLEAQKLVKSFPGKATIVTELETENIEKWYQPMAVLQQLAITLAVDKITPAHINRLRNLSDIFKMCIRDRPNEGIVLKIGMKVPGAGFEVKQVTMDFSYDQLGGVPSGDAYARLIDDCIQGDPCLLYTSRPIVNLFSYPFAS